MNHDWPAECPRDRLHRYIVMSWTDSARSDDEFEVARAVTNFIGYRLQFIRNYGDALECHTDFSQFARRKIGIGVVHLAGEDFVSYHHHPAIALLHRGNLHFRLYNSGGPKPSRSTARFAAPQVLKELGFGLVDISRLVFQEFPQTAFQS